MPGSRPTIKVDGFTFRDLDDDRQLPPYEDWRCSAAREPVAVTAIRRRW